MPPFSSSMGERKLMRKSFVGWRIRDNRAPEKFPQAARTVKQSSTKGSQFFIMNFVLFVRSFENTARRGLGQFKQNPSIASFQHGVLESY
jgi:hypothetical protein